MPPRLPLSLQRPKRPDNPGPVTGSVPVPIERNVDFCRIFVDGKKLPGEARISHALQVWKLTRTRLSGYH